MKKKQRKEDPGKVQIGSYRDTQIPTKFGKVQLGYYGATPPVNTGQVIIGKYESWESACNPNIII